MSEDDNDDDYAQSNGDIMGKDNDTDDATNDDEENSIDGDKNDVTTESEKCIQSNANINVFDEDSL